MPRVRETPFEDVVDIGHGDCARQGLDAETAKVAGRLSLALFFAETGGNQNIGNARSNQYKGSLQTGVAEDRRGRRKWEAIKATVAELEPAVGRPRRQGGGPRRRHRSALQSLDRGAQRTDERARRPVSADSGDRRDASPTKWIR